MADPQEEVVGERQETEATPMSQKDVVKENGELPASENLAEIGGKEKEDPTLKKVGNESADIPPATEKAESAATLPEEAHEANGPSSPALESSFSEGGQEGEKAEEEGETLVHSPEEEQGSTMDSTQETSPSLPDLDSKPSEETTHEPDVQKAETKQGTKVGEADIVPPLAEGTAQSEGPQGPESTATEKVDEPPEGTAPSDEPQAAESTDTEVSPEKAQTEEIPESIEQTKVEGLEGLPESADNVDTHEHPEIAKEESPMPVDAPNTEDASGIIQPVDTAKTDDALKTHVSETEARKSTETNGTQAEAQVGRKDIPLVQSEENSDEAGGVEDAKEGIPTTFDTNEADEGSKTEAVEGAISKADDTTERDTLEPQVVKGQIPELNEGNVSEAAADVDEVGSKPVSEEIDSKATTTAEESAERRQGEEDSAQEVPAAVDAEVPTIAGQEGDSAAHVGPATPIEGHSAEPRQIEERSEQEGPVGVDDEVANVVGQEGDSAADPGQETSTAKDSAEARQIEEGISQELPADVDEAVPKIVGEEGGSGAEAGQAVTAAGDRTESRKIGDTHEDLASPLNTAEEQEQPAGEANEDLKPKSYFGVVLKHVEPNNKLSTEGSPMGNHHSSDGQSSDQVDKSPAEAQGEHAPPQPAVVAEQETTSGDAAPSDVGQEKEAAPTTAETAAPVAIGDSELPENPTAETPEFGDSTKEIGASVPEVEEKETPPPEVSRELPGGATESEQDTVSDKVEEAVETKQNEDNPQEMSKEVEDRTDQSPEEASTGAKPEEASLPADSAMEKEPSLSVNVPKQGEAAAPDDVTTPRGTPLMQRVEHLEHKLAQHESRQSPRADFASTAHSTPRSSVDKLFNKHSTRHVLEETGSKGTLLDRVAALEQRLSHILLSPQSPSNSQPISTVVEDSTPEDSKSAESQTQEPAPTAAEGGKAPEQVKTEEASKVTEDPLKPSAEQNGPKTVPTQMERMTSRTNSLKAKAAVGKITGIFAGCFNPKGKAVS